MLKNYCIRVAFILEEEDFSVAKEEASVRDICRRGNAQGLMDQDGP